MKNFKELPVIKTNYFDSRAADSWVDPSREEKTTTAEEAFPPVDLMIIKELAARKGVEPVKLAQYTNHVSSPMDYSRHSVGIEAVDKDGKSTTLIQKSLRYFYSGEFHDKWVRDITAEDLDLSGFAPKEKERIRRGLNKAILEGLTADNRNTQKETLDFLHTLNPDTRRSGITRGTVDRSARPLISPRIEDVVQSFLLSESSEKFRAVGVLGLAGGERSIKPLIEKSEESTDSEDEIGIRRECFDAVCLIGGKKAVEYLSMVSQFSLSESERARAVAGIGSMLYGSKPGKAAEAVVDRIGEIARHESGNDSREAGHWLRMWKYKLDKANPDWSEKLDDRLKAEIETAPPIQQLGTITDAINMLTWGNRAYGTDKEAGTYIKDAIRGTYYEAADPLVSVGLEQTLIGKLNHQDIAVQEEAAYALSMFGGDKSVAPLITAYNEADGKREEGKEDVVQKHFMIATGRIGGPEAVENLFKIVSSTKLDNDSVVFTVTNALGFLRFYANTANEIDKEVLTDRINAINSRGNRILEICKNRVVDELKKK